MRDDVTLTGTENGISEMSSNYGCVHLTVLSSRKGA